MRESGLCGWGSYTRSIGGPPLPLLCPPRVASHPAIGAGLSTAYAQAGVCPQLYPQGGDKWSFILSTRYPQAPLPSVRATRTRSPHDYRYLIVITNIVLASVNRYNHYMDMGAAAARGSRAPESCPSNARSIGHRQENKE